MSFKTTIVLFFLYFVAFCIAVNESEVIEGRGKKKKKGGYNDGYGHEHGHLYLYFADLIVKKIFILKLIYAFVLWCIIHKAGYFLTWFVHYLKEKKQEFKEPEHHHHHDHGHYEYGPPQSYSSWGPYRKSYKVRN